MDFRDILKKDLNASLEDKELTMKKHEGLFKKAELEDPTYLEDIEPKENKLDNVVDNNPDKINELPGHRMSRKVINDKLMSSGHFDKTKKLREDEKINGRGVN